MILTCPNCATRYLVDPTKLGSGGRAVRCAKCRHTWHQDPPDDMPKKVEVLDPPAAVRPIPRGSNLPSVRKPPRRRSPLTGWAALVTVFIVAAGAAYWSRARIVEIWPPAARVFALVDSSLVPANAVGLELRDVNARFETENGTQILVVSGKVASVAKTAVAVPAIRINLLDKKEKTLFYWTFNVEKQMLEAGETVEFTTRLPDPPARVAGLEATFETQPKTEAEAEPNTKSNTEPEAKPEARQ